MHRDEFEDFGFQLESRLMSHGVYVTSFEESESVYEIEYESYSAENGIIPHSEVGRIINVIRDFHRNDWTGCRIEGTVLDLEGTLQGTWHVEADWIDGLHNGDLSEVEFSQNVIATVG